MRILVMMANWKTIIHQVCEHARNVMLFILCCNFAAKAIFALVVMEVHLSLCCLCPIDNIIDMSDVDMTIKPRAVLSKESILRPFAIPGVCYTLKVMTITLCLKVMLQYFRAKVIWSYLISCRE